MSEETNQPDFTKPFSRWNATYWAMEHGIAEALDASAWSLMCAFYHHLPNVKPGKGRLAKLSGLSESSVKRLRPYLRDAGLISYTSNAGGYKDTATVYHLADVRYREVADTIIAKLAKGGHGDTGVMVNPVHGEPPTGVMVNPHGGQGEPPTGVMVNPKVHKASTQTRTQEKDVGPAARPLSAKPLEDAKVGETQELVGSPELNPQDHTNSQELVTSQSFPTPGPSTNSPATNSRKTSKSEKAAKNPKEKAEKAAKARPLTEEQKEAIFNDPELMRAYLCYGAAVLSKPKAEWDSLEPTKSHWHVGVASPDQPSIAATPAQLGAYWWWRVSIARKGVGLITRLPDFGLLHKSFEELSDRMLQTQLVQIIDFTCSRWADIKSQLGPTYGATLSLSEGLLKIHSQVVATAERLMTSPSQQFIPTPTPTQGATNAYADRF